MDTSKEHVRNLFDEKYYRYAGRCRHCGFENEWVVDKKGMDYRSFYRVVSDNYYPQFINYCDNCGNHAVYDLTAIQAEEA